MAKVRENGECSACGFPLTAGQTKVRYDRKTVVACEVCEPELAESIEDTDPRLLRVRVITQRYVNADGTFFIYVAELDDKAQDDIPVEAKKWFSLTGPIGSLARGDVVNVYGKFSSHEKYGLQFECTTAAELAVRESEAGLRAFLGRLPNIGPVRAFEVIREFGGHKEVLEILDNDHRRLTKISGITEERADEIKLAYDSQAGYREFRLFAAKIGLTEAIVAEAIEEWGDEAQKNIDEDPFILMNLDRVGFKIADGVHTKLGRDPKVPARCAACVLLALEEAANEGHCYVEEVMLKRRDVDILRALTRDEVEVGLVELEKTRRDRKKRKSKARVLGRYRDHEADLLGYLPPRIVRRLGRVYLYEVDQAEHQIMKELQRLLSMDLEPIENSADVWKGMSPALEQKLAVETCCVEPIMVMIGGAGVGKSTTTRAMLDVLEGAGLNSCLLAPTGKAAQRLKELTGRETSTIHRALGFLHSSADCFTLAADVVVVDEVSMCDTILFAQLLRSVKTGTRLILVGDNHQLPSIGPGNVLTDLIKSGILPCVELTKIFRQQSDGEKKRIPEFARSIRNGTMPDIQKKGTDVVFIEADDPEIIAEKIVLAVTEQIPAKYNYSVEEIQVIAPQWGEQHKKNWPIGVKALNMALQGVLNPKGGIEVFINDGFVARRHDRVMHTRNNYELKTFNGEQGYVEALYDRPTIVASDIITSQRTQRAEEAAQCEQCGGSGEVGGGGMGSDNMDVMYPYPCSACSKRSKAERPSTIAVVNYGDRRVGYNKQELRELRLAYALTGHSMQGSSSRAVVMVVHELNKFMLTRQLLYTIATRAEEYLLVIGQAQQFERALRNTKAVERRTSLLELLLEDEAT